MHAIPALVARREDLGDPVGDGGDGAGRGERRHSCAPPTHEIRRNDVVDAEEDVGLDKDPPTTRTAAAAKERRAQLGDEDSLSEPVAGKRARKRLCVCPGKDLVLASVLGRGEKVLPVAGGLAAFAPDMLRLTTVRRAVA
jgi:hypothetical protein